MMQKSRTPSLSADESALMSVLSYSLLQNARPQKAMTLLEALDVLEPGKPQTLRALAIAQIRSDKGDKALRTLDRLAMAGGVDQAFHLLRAQALMSAGRPLEASVSMKNFVQMRQAANPPAVAPRKRKG